MIEKIPDDLNKFENQVKEKAESKFAKIALAIELNESRETFIFPGMREEDRLKLKAFEEEFPGHVTPIDELVERFKDEDMKVVLGKDPGYGSVFILPAHSDDIENDSILPKTLQIIDGMDESIRELISLDRG